MDVEALKNESNIYDSFITTKLTNNSFGNDKNDINYLKNREARILLDSIKPQVYCNLIFTSLPALSINALDKDVSYYFKYLKNNSSSLYDIDMYMDDIISNLYVEELVIKPSARYMERQSELTPIIRFVLINWLIDVHGKFKLVPNTLFLTINILDRFLSKEDVDKKHIQLVTCSAMLIASKYEDIYSPEVKDFKYACNNAYSDEQFLRAEYEILRALNFDILNVTSFSFLEAIGFVINLSNFEFNYSRMLLELCLYDYKLLKFNSSLISCTVIYITLKSLNKNKKLDLFMDKYNRYSFENIKEVADLVCVLIRNSNNKNCKNVSLKFSFKEFYCVSNILDNFREKLK